LFACARLNVDISLSWLIRRKASSIAVRIGFASTHALGPVARAI
jgi:hypothetical protein